MTIDNSGLFSEASNIHIIAHAHQLNEGERRFLGGQQQPHQSTASTSVAKHDNVSQQHCHAMSKAKRSTHSSTTSSHDQRSHDGGGDINAAIGDLRKENADIRNDLAELRAQFEKLALQIGQTVKATVAPVVAHVEQHDKKSVSKEADEDIDLFGSSDEEENVEKERIKQQRLDAYAEKKSKKPALIAKSSVLLDVKPWDDETDIAVMETNVRSIEMPGLIWGAAKQIPLAYGIKKLQILCVIEDDKVSVEDLIEKITDDFADYVQSVDIAAFNKI